jgi:capsular polysaccharide transport system permease protein
MLLSYQKARSHKTLLGAKNLTKKVNKLFLLTVIIPTTLASIYYGVIASNVYISESKFIVYNPQSSGSGAVGLSSLLSGAGFSNNTYGVDAVQNYLLSRNALQQLQKSIDIEKMYSSPDIDWINRFGGLLYYRNTFENFYKYYTNVVGDDVDVTSNISTVTVRAYSAADAQLINQNLLTLAQQLVDRINAQADDDTVLFYGKEVADDEAQVRDAGIAMADFRNKHGIFNPVPQSTLQLQLVEKLQDQLIQQQSVLAQMLLGTPNNPQVRSIKKAIESTREEIAQQTAGVAGNQNSLSSQSVAYESLSLSQNFAERELAASIDALEQSRIRAQKQQLYIENVVSPNLPDEALEPKRMRGILAVFILGLFLWGIFSVILAGVKEHHDR